MKSPSPNALKLILDYEIGGGQEYYDKFLSKFTWPGGASGPTCGIGIDCAYYTKEELGQLFSFLPPDQVSLVQDASGKKGQFGRDYTPTLRKAGITVPWEQALQIFNNLTWTKFANLTEKAFMGVTELHDDAYGALVSLVFNRGSSLSGDSRLEMRNIRVLVPKHDYKGIANELRKMKRIWQGKGLDGLLARREAEAQLVESCG